MRRLGKRVLAAVVASSMIAMPVCAAPSIDELKENKAAAQSEANSLQSQLVKIVSKIDKLERDLISTGEKIDKATVDLKKAEEKERQQYEDMKLRIKYMYEDGNTTALETLVSATDFSDLLNKAEYVQNVHSYDREKLKEYVETKKQVSDLKSELEKEEKDLQTMQTEYQAQEKDLDMLIEEKSAEVENLDEQIQEAAAEAARIAAEEERKRQEAAAAAAAAANENQAANEQEQSDEGDTDSDGGQSEPESDEPESSEPKSEPSYSASTGNAIVDRAYSKLGCPYSYGKCGPNSFDCSGFVSYCLTGSYTRIGTSGDFAGWPKVSNPQPGDVCVKPGHVGIYIGGGQMIHAPQTGDVVKISAVHSGMWYVRR